MDDDSELNEYEQRVKAVLAANGVAGDDEGVRIIARYDAAYRAAMVRIAAGVATEEDYEYIPEP